MPNATRTITVSRPSAEVFAFFSDPANDPRWRPQVTEIAREGTAAVGTRVHQVVAGPGGRGIPADIEITRYEPPTRYAFRGVAGPVRPVGEFTFTPAGDGASTSVTFSLSAELTGVKKLFMAGSVQKAMNGEMAALDTAKGVLEGG